MNKYEENPFIVGQPVVGSDFFGREDILEKVKSFLSNPEKNIFFISGQRRSGKTSLLKKIQEEISDNEHIFLYFNLQGKADLEMSEISLIFQKRINKSLDIQEDNYKSSFTYYISELSKKNKSQITLLFDEFDVMCNPEENSKNKKAKNEFVNFLISVSEFIKKSNINLRFIIASGQNNYSSENDSCKAILSKSIFENLSSFDKNTTKKILQSADNIRFTENAISEINTLTAGSPYLIQAMSHSLYENAIKNNLKKIKRKTVSKNIDSVVHRFTFGLNSIWNDISSNDKITLYLSAKLQRKKKTFCTNDIIAFAKINNIHINISEIEDSLRNLEKNDFFVKNSDGKYSFKNEFFRKWIIIDVDIREINKISR